MTPRGRGPRVLGAWIAGLVWSASLVGACGSVPDLTFEPGDASMSAADAEDGSSADASGFSDACSFPCMGSACAVNCAACAMCPPGEICCAKANASLQCKQAGKCPP
jgi:hypothetical protein